MSWIPLAAAGIGALGSILGSRGSSRTQSTGNSGTGYSQFAPSEATLPLYGMLAGQGQTMGQTPTPYFPGMGYVGPSSPAQYGIDMGMGSMPYYDRAATGLGQAAGSYGQAADTLMGVVPGQQRLADTAVGNYDFLSGAADVANNPYVTGMMDVNRQQVNQNFLENILPAINQGAQQVNALGSSRQGIAQAQGAERTAQQLANANQQLLTSAYGQGLGAQQNALSSLAGVQQGLAQPGVTQGLAGQYQGIGGSLQGSAGDALNRGAQNALGYGGTVEGYQQKALDDAMARFQYQYGEPWQRAGNVQGLLSGPLGRLGTSATGSSGSSTAPNPGYQSPFQAAVGGGAAGLGMYDAYRRANASPAAAYSNPAAGYSNSGFFY